MVGIVNPDCWELGCGWVWGKRKCWACGQAHTYRLCCRCRTVDDPVCPLGDGTNDGQVAS